MGVTRSCPLPQLCASAILVVEIAAPRPVGANGERSMSMSKKRISHSTRLSGPSPGQIRRRNLIIGVVIIAAIALVVVIAAGMARGGNQAANNQGAKAPVPAASSQGTTQQTASTNTPAVQGAASGQQTAPPQADKSAHRVTIATSRGQIVLDVYPDLMPITVANFDKLVKSGFYNGLTWHRVEGWVIQGGDPKGDGTGGSSQTIKLETNPQLNNIRGAVAMARSSDPNSASSQFYILKKDQSSLDGQYAVFGKVISGMDVVDQIQQGDKMLSVKE